MNVVVNAQENDLSNTHSKQHFGEARALPHPYIYSTLAHKNDLIWIRIANMVSNIRPFYDIIKMQRNKEQGCKIDIHFLPNGPG